MIYRVYQAKTFDFRKRAIIDHCREIIEDFSRQGYDMTLRQIYYQLVSLDLIANNQLEYNRLQVLVGDARLAGLLPWDAIVDRTRNLVDYNTYESPDEIVKACADWYRRDLWEGQGMTIEVWIEKDALAGVFDGICNRLRIPLFSCRGYTSLSEMWGAGQRILRREKNKGRGTFILHFGDHDPSGIDMSRDIRDRLSMFCDNRDVFLMQRVALNMSQIREYNPPPNFAKLTDSRRPRYVREFGTQDCWELDALQPQQLVSLVKDTRDRIIDHEVWDEQQAIENAESQELRELADRFREERSKKD